MAFRPRIHRASPAAAIDRGIDRAPRTSGMAGATWVHMEEMDAIIGREVEAELESNHWIHARQLCAKVEAGVVRLMGTVNSLAESLAAEQAAFGVRGVIDVINELRVVRGGPARTDVDLAQAVRHALVWNALVPDERISSNVTNGVVRLHGTVDHPAEREEAERSVCHLAGVRRLHNLIDVRPSDVAAREKTRAVDRGQDQCAQAKAGPICVEAHEGTVMHGERRTNCAE
jgi:osmotically-inducible protein OsmY